MSEVLLELNTYHFGFCSIEDSSSFLFYLVLHISHISHIVPGCSRYSSPHGQHGQRFEEWPRRCPVSLSIRPKAASEGADLTRCEGKAEVAESECTNGTCHHLTALRNLTFTSFMSVFTLVLYAHLCPTC